MIDDTFIVYDIILDKATNLIDLTTPGQYNNFIKYLIGSDSFVITEKHEING